jgi:non-ribosomal peptide synthetase component E (peptide arylation enzyme)
MGLDWQPRSVAPELVSSYRQEGFWTGESLGGLLGERLAARREQSFKLRSDLRPWSGTFGDVLDGSRRVAAGLAAVGVGAGDVVAFQLPNWIEAALVFYGASLLGAVVAPIVHFYGPKEVRYILDRSGAHAAVLLGEGQAEQSHLREAGPRLLVEPGVGLDDGPALLAVGVGAGQQAAHGFPEVVLLAVVVEVHGCLTTPGSSRR